MKKFIFIGVVFVMLITLGCSLKDIIQGLSIFNSEEFYVFEKDDLGSEHKRLTAEEMCMNLLKAIESKDKELLKSYFSEQAVSEADNLDLGMEYVFDLYKGSYTESTDKGVTPINTYGYGVSSTKIEAYYEITTTENKYFLYFEYWSENEEDPDAVGVYTFKLSDLDVVRNTENFDVGWKNPLPGIYYPAWDEKVVE